MGIPLVQGRGFTRDDNRATAPCLNGGDPRRERISVLTHEQNAYDEIIGVVGDEREGALDKSAVLWE
jgi:hypothetical protein